LFKLAKESLPLYRFSIKTDSDPFMKRKIEILAPAKNLIQGIAAINAGADAVYIGAPLFGARTNATNSIDDIAEMVRYAHLI
jgi:collagenase-like PrtC family protease